MSSEFVLRLVHLLTWYKPEPKNTPEAEGIDLTFIQTIWENIVPGQQAFTYQGFCSPSEDLMKALSPRGKTAYVCKMICEVMCPNKNCSVN